MREMYTKNASNSSGRGCETDKPSAANANQGPQPPPQLNQRDIIIRQKTTWSLRSSGPALDLHSSHRSGVGPRLRLAARPTSVDGLLGQQFDLSHQETLLVRELVVVRSVLQKFRQESQQSVAVVDEDSLHSHRFVRIGHKHLYRQSMRDPPLDCQVQHTLKTWNPSYCTILRSSRSSFMQSLRFSPLST